MFSEVDLAQVDLSLSLLFVCNPICFLRPELQLRVYGTMQIRELIWGWEKKDAQSIVWFIVKPHKAPCWDEGRTRIKPGTTHFTSDTEVHWFKQIKKV